MQLQFHFDDLRINTKSAIYLQSEGNKRINTLKIYV